MGRVCYGGIERWTSVVATVVREFKIIQLFVGFLSGIAVDIALDIVASKGRKRCSEWCHRCLKPMPTPTPAADITFPGYGIKPLNMGIAVSIWVHRQFAWATMLLSTHVTKP